jgi:hypothetical protein
MPNKNNSNLLNTIIALKKRKNELQKAYDILIEENNNLRAKRKYWEMKYKKLEKLIGV